MKLQDVIYGLSDLTDDEKRALYVIVRFCRSSRYFENTYEFAHTPVDLKNWLCLPMTRLRAVLRALETKGWIQWYPLTGQITVRLLGTLKGAIKIKMISEEE